MEELWWLVQDQLRFQVKQAVRRRAFCRHATCAWDEHAAWLALRFIHTSYSMLQLSRAVAALCAVSALGRFAAQHTCLFLACLLSCAYAHIHVSSIGPCMQDILLLSLKTVGVF